MTFYQIMTKTGLPVAYSHFTSDQKPPFLVYIGDGQDQFKADNEIYTAQNTYQVELYYKEKNEASESAVEKVLTDAGYFYDKSADTYIQDQALFVIYYSAWKKGFYNE